MAAKPTMSVSQHGPVEAISTGPPRDSGSTASVDVELKESHRGNISRRDTALTAVEDGTVAPAATQLTAVQTPQDPDLEPGHTRLTENDSHHATARVWPTWEKWIVLCIVFVVQTSMNFNASIYANAVPGMMDDFSIGAVRARMGQWLFLIAYAFGCELWAPWSEELGRKPIMQTSLALVNVFALLCALAPSDAAVFVGRFFGGLSSAGGSVTLGIVADMYLPSEQQFAVAFVVLSSVAGSVFGPVVGGFVQTYLSWRWVFWLQLIFGGATQILHLVFCPETDMNVLIGRHARKLRRDEGKKVWGPNEKKSGRFHWRKILGITIRPYKMLALEPIVLCLSLLSGFSDALIFTFLESYGVVFAQWNFDHIAIGLSFIPLIIGYILAYFSFFPFFFKQRKVMCEKGVHGLRPEDRLYWLLWLAPLEFLGLFAFGAASLGPARGVHWIVPLFFSTFIGIANFAIYMATIDYMVAAYGRFASSATGGNGFSRDLLAGIAALYASPFYHNVKGEYSLEIPTWTLGAIALVVTAPIYLFYFKGEWFRKRSSFANEIAAGQRKVEQGITCGDVEKGNVSGTA